MMTVSEWAAETSASLMGGPAPVCEAIPLDRILGDAYKAGEALGLGHDCFGQLLAAVRPASDVLMARIVFPLSVSHGLETSHSELVDLQGELSEFEPPSLYLCRRTFSQRMSDFEEYRVPIGQAIHEVPDGVVNAFYTCYRDRQAREQGWEYYRAVWFEHYPAALAVRS